MFRFALQQKVIPVLDARAPVALWRPVRAMPEFDRLLAVRLASPFGDGLLRAGLAGVGLVSAVAAADPILCGASLVDGVAWFVSSALAHVVMNSVAATAVQPQSFSLS